MNLSPRTDDLVLPPAKTRLVVLGDPHGDLPGLETALRLEASPSTGFVSAGDNIGYGDGAASSALCAKLIERGIKSVFGNHEAWTDDGGRLFMVDDRGAPKQLSGEAHAWCRGLPFRLRVKLEAAPETTISVVHTLATPVDDGFTWDYVTSANADILADAEGARVAFCGHSHGPTVYEISPEGVPKTRRLTIEEGESVTVKIKKGWRYVVDCGSLARPGFHPEPGRLDLASWGFLDVMRRVIGVRCARKTAVDT